MDENFNYKEVPKNYLHCLNAHCLRSADCLRFQVALRAGHETTCFMVVNPIIISEQEECRYFRPDRLTRFALGMKHLFDNLPLKKADKIKDVLYKHFGRNMFYRFINKEHLISPEDQAFVQDVFKREGIEEEPVFDTYIDQYYW